MKVKKSMPIILLSIILLLLTACSDDKVQLSIKPEINKYSPLMSSVPGIPLNAELKTKISGENIKFHWTAEQGTFLSWDGGKVETLGKNVKTDRQKIYWSIDTNEKIKKSSFRIYLKVEDANSSKVISETSIQIEQDRKGFFLVKEQ